jgi:cytochrome c oxidase subunit 1
MSTILSLGLVRGLIANVIGVVLGMGFTALVRALLGLPAWEPEPMIVVGAIVGGIAFMIGAGAFSDWFKWVRGQATPLHHGPPEGKSAWSRYLSVDYSHKIIGVQYTVTGILLLLLAGGLAIIFRFELAQTGLQFLSLDTYNTMMSAHGIIMIASILLGIGGMANYLVPLMIGASDMAFPRLNAFAFWINVPGALMVVAAMFVGGWDTGWTGRRSLFPGCLFHRHVFYPGRA